MDKKDKNTKLLITEKGVPHNYCNSYKKYTITRMVTNIVQTTNVI